MPIRHNHSAYSVNRGLHSLSVFHAVIIVPVRARRSQRTVSRVCRRTVQMPVYHRAVNHCPTLRDRARPSVEQLMSFHRPSALLSPHKTYTPYDAQSLTLRSAALSGGARVMQHRGPQFFGARNWWEWKNFNSSDWFTLQFRIVLGLGSVTAWWSQKAVSQLADCGPDFS